MIKKIYMDVCCLNRPFDNQSQVRVHLESEAILQIIQFSKNGKLNWFNSDVIEFEIDNIENEDKKEKVLTLLELSTSKIELNDGIINKSKDIQKLGLRPLDALHVAVAIFIQVDVFLTTDDKLEKIGKKNKSILGIDIDNPLNWIKNII
jgi:predicted nucleic acid-binding protein